MNTLTDTTSTEVGNAEPCHLHGLTRAGNCPTCTRLEATPETVDLFAAGESSTSHTGEVTER